MLDVDVSNSQALLKFSNDTIEKCRVSVGARAAYYRLLNALAETGSYDGTKSLINMLYGQLDRMAANLFSPVELRFTIDFDRIYPKDILDKSAVVAKQLTRHWARSSTDKTFARGVFDSLKYGGSILKQWSQQEQQAKPHYYAKLVMPWQFGVWNEAENDIYRQPAVCEISTITLPEVWRRIWHLPNAKTLFERVRSHAMTGNRISEPQSFFHQVLSTSQLQTGVTGATRPLPGGIVQLNNDPNYAIMGPQVSAETVEVNELWVQDDEDYTTIIQIDPDIIIAPTVVGKTVLKKINLLGVEGKQPYSLIQPNEVSGWFWGRSELVDLIEPQALLSSLASDAKRLTGLQVDKILGFIGEDKMTDELYGQFRTAGYANLGPNSKIEDLTPEFPNSLLEMIKFMIEQINARGAFPDILQGKGEPGVRSSDHADTLLKTASPTQRDRALIVERQCAEAADLTLSIMEAKDSARYWTKADTIEDVEKSSFLLSDLPEDWCVNVDSHRSSPIFASENTQKVTYAHKTGIVDGEYVIDHLELPDAEVAKTRLREKQGKEQEMLQNLLKQDPQLGHKVLEKKFAGGGKH